MTGSPEAATWANCELYWMPLKETPVGEQPVERSGEMVDRIDDERADQRLLDRGEGALLGRGGYPSAHHLHDPGGRGRCRQLHDAGRSSESGSAHTIMVVVVGRDSAYSP